MEITLLDIFNRLFVYFLLSAGTYIWIVLWADNSKKYKNRSGKQEYKLLFLAIILGIIFAEIINFFELYKY